MSARVTDFEPGDLAVIRWRHDESAGTTRAVRDRKGWTSLDETVGFILSGDVIDGRPLLVIDPEDRGQVERLTSVMMSNGWSGIDAEPPDDMQRVLREFANPMPPKPAEPTNYLAVAQTSDDKRYWRWSAGVAHTGWPWRLLGAVHADTEEDDGNFRWDDLDVVEIVSEGVTA